MTEYLRNGNRTKIADKPTLGQSSRWLVNSRTSRLTETFDL